jgi:uncharacterized membrane protein YdjX (TVP38/TMEM64 family)
MEARMAEEAVSSPVARGGRARLVVGGLALVAVIVLLRTLPVTDWLLAFVAWIRGAGTTGMAVFVAAYVAACVFFLPAFLLTLGAGFAYGVVTGSFLVWLSASLGATAAFLLGRTVARDAIAHRVETNPKFASIDRAVGREGRKIVFLTRLSPMFPFVLLNYAYGLTKVGLRDYVLGTTLGMFPGVVMYVYLGSLFTNVAELATGNASGGTAKQVLTFIGFAATVAVSIVVARIARRALDEATADAPHAKAPAEPIPAAPMPDALLRPDDEPNEALLAHVHPSGWRNPTPSGRYNLVVVGGGTAGLVSAAGGAGLGAKVALVERHLLGGDCLNVGCVPSKSIIGAARIAAQARDGARFGIRTGRDRRRLPCRHGADAAAPRVPCAERRCAALRRARRGRLSRPGTVHGADDDRGRRPDARVRARGHRDRRARGGAADSGPRRRRVPDERDRLLAHRAAAAARDHRRRTHRVRARAGVSPARRRRHGAERRRASPAARRCRCRCDRREAAHDRGRAPPERRLDHARRAPRPGSDPPLHAGRRRRARGRRSRAGGRRPHAERPPSRLDAAGVAYDGHGVTVDDYLRTTNKRIYAAGDVCSRFQFTHTADAHARIVLTNALFLGRRKASALVVPWCTYTSPEVAHVGLSERDAAARGLATDTITIPLHDVDRARLDGEDDGFLRVLLAKGSDRILGATLVAAHAGDMISEITVAMAGKVGLGTLANVIHPYPTQAEVIKKAADAWNRTRLTPRVKSLFAWWLGVRR